MKINLDNSNNITRIQSHVPQSAIDMMNIPWNNGEVSHKSLIGRLAPDITTVSKPNKKPDRATDIDQ